MFAKRTVTLVIYGLLAVFSIISLVLAALAWSRTISFYLPLPTSLPGLATLLSPISGLLLLVVHIFYRNTSETYLSNSTRYPIRYIIDQMLTIIPSIIGTIALAYLFPGEILTCHLDERWQSYFQSKNADVIRSIQDRLRCCGLRSIHDRAWPFKDRTHGDDACELQLGYDRSCLMPWRQQQQTVSWMVFASAVLIWALKIGFTQLDRRRATNWMNSSAAGGQINYRRIPDSEVHEEQTEDENVEGTNRPLPPAGISYVDGWVE